MQLNCFLGRSYRTLQVTFRRRFVDPGLQGRFQLKGIKVCTLEPVTLYMENFFFDRGQSVRSLVLHRGGRLQIREYADALRNLPQAFWVKSTTRERRFQESFCCVRMEWNFMSFCFCGKFIALLEFGTFYDIAHSCWTVTLVKFKNKCLLLLTFDVPPQTLHRGFWKQIYLSGV